jgi:hypothetical protein
MKNEASLLPNSNRISIISASILLIYALIPFIKSPGQRIQIQLPGLFLQYDFEFGTLISVLVAAMAALGADWLIQTHPDRKKHSFVQHGFVPALTTWVIGVPLNTLSVGTEWWVVFALGGILLVLVLIAEYIVVNPNSAAYVPASLGLTVVSFSLYLILSIAIRAGGFRLFLMLPALIPTLGLLVLRSLYLSSNGKWHWFWALGIALFVGQIAIGLHYLPIQSLTFGLILVGIAYPLTTFVSGLVEGRISAGLWVEPLFLFIFFMTMAFLIKA